MLAHMLDTKICIYVLKTYPLVRALLLITSALKADMMRVRSSRSASRRIAPWCGIEAKYRSREACHKLAE